LLAGSAGVALFAQGRGGPVWTTAHGDAQRTSSVRADPRISVATMSKSGFQLLWKRQVEPQAKGAGLTQPVFSTAGYITYKGFKGLLYLGGVPDDLFSIDYDLNKPFWNVHLSTASKTPGSGACSGGLTSITRETALASAAPPAGQGAGRGAAPAAAAPAAPGAPQGRPGGGGGGGGGGRGNAAVVLAVSSGGMLHIANPQTGADMTPPLKLLPSANANVVGTMMAADMFYAATSSNCAGVANGIYAMDLAPAAAAAPAGRATGPVAPDVKPANASVLSWTTSANLAGPTGFALGTDGTVYVTTRAGKLVALDGKTLKEKDSFSPGSTPFTASPIVFQLNGKDVVAAANQNGHIYLCDGASLKTPLVDHGGLQAGAAVRGLSTAEGPDGTRWLFLAVTLARPESTPAGTITDGAVLAGKVTNDGGKPAIQHMWNSRNLVAPTAPAIVNGVVFALSAGAATRPAVLYALDAATGKELWNSGAAIISSVHGVAPAINDSQVYVVTGDGVLYTFGFIVER